MSARIFIKGGVWKNTEDEILKAAVMKYGPNQWDRVASLLHRKSAAQCKRRWYEWLDPSIKKTEWSREEEEKLLHLAKLMPTQWMTFAPMIGRTASQCLEHYEKLLDQAQGSEPIGQDDPRRLRPGEIDPMAHTRPARPDPIDMDEDEKEMLSEARARLANTQGKKAKRKARERQLIEAKRLARLQKRREMRAAGIELKQRKRRSKMLDYNAEIPFQKLAPKGFHDPSEDDAIKLDNLRLRRRKDVEGMSKQAMEEKARREDEKKLEELKKKNLPAALMKLNQIKGDEPQRKRSKLVLPAPQVSDEELEELVKLGQTGVDALATMDESGPTGALLQDYRETPSISQAARTPKAPQGEDNLLKEAKNIIALQQTGSVLEGGENTPLHDGGGSFSGVTPQRAQTATPNRVLSTPYRGATVQHTPSRHQTPAATPATPDEASTPLRDKLGINREKDSRLLTPSTKEDRERQRDIKASLRDGLASLPQPKRDYEIVVPEIEDEEERTDMDIEKDAAEVDEEEEERKRLIAEKEFKRQSQALQRGLALPSSVNEDVFTARQKLDDLQAADEQIKQEMLNLLKQDKSLIKQLEKPTDEEMAAARAALDEEIAAVRKEKHGDAATDESIADEYMQSWQRMHEDVTFVAGKKRYGRTSLCSKQDLVDTRELEHKRLVGFMTKDFKKAAKMEKKLLIALGGYQKRAAAIRKSIAALGEQLEQARLQKKAFEVMRLNELKIIPERRQQLATDVDAEEKRQTELQARYRQLAVNSSAAQQQ
ncbi:Cdc5l protein [Salpingoeca rosetta]|uniref:Cdc5l protein n=1 Tax=Salpingoeca rosetta (strain ATCC 50818 / BSB-021) TaxID=946362 RepID=F2UM84_SALR5|nr:Cdc5l protein [Salpingoeca rosetta]EGD78233.1 Cdc5l protein [Salpingoeca rosetta]|eukprot:XP_004989556.1 Cdc5l protein [Salpingoeca rosetta]